MSRVIFEAIVASVDDARAAAAGGADRFEVCSALALGGLTPSLGTVRAIKEVVGVPMVCMVRPREGGMAYDQGEFLAMLQDRDVFLEQGVDGIVFGFLTENSEVDVGRCRKFLRPIRDLRGERPVETVFHRAFDVVSDPDRALEELIDLGVSRILTSGRRPTALEGIPEIRRMIEKAGGRIEILPGGGIDADSVVPILSQTGAAQVHLYLSHIAKDHSVSHNPAIYFGAHLPGNEFEYRRVDEAKAREIRKLLDLDEPDR